MRKNLNKLATLALSGMMVMSMAVPAFAQDVHSRRESTPMVRLLHQTQPLILRLPLQLKLELSSLKKMEKM